MYHFPKYDKEQKREKEEQIKERKRTRRRRRKEKILKPSWKEQTQQATFPVLVERSKASPPLRHRTRINYSTEFEALHSALDFAENSDNGEYYVTRNPPSRNGISLTTEAAARNVDPLPARRSIESMLGLDLTEMQMRLKKPNKLPPIDKENRSQHTDEYPYMKRY
ncbi:hypothetical protein AWC38_SpisGene955 [Stylophora pistillata]|uniref:Uncharacterized protein n=1 Tax=Stylophora pistillata TaxID=50429 RepID=A0A2B4T067_STYPI|nr:hypothetical protein AWC38_SpisGene955 [Stylophora pistillata]